MSEDLNVTVAECQSNSTESRVSFCVDEKFPSFIDFEKKLKEYERYNAVQLSRCDSRTLEAAAKRVPKRVAGAPSKLKYYEVHYTCLFGGKTYKRKGSGIRKHQSTTILNSTIKQGCSAGVKLILSKDKRHLEVTYVSENHNHIMNKDVCNHLPRQRHLNSEESATVKSLLHEQANKKLVQQHISQASGKIVSLKDLSNMRAEINDRSAIGNDLQSVVKDLTAIKGATVNNEKNELTVILSWIVDSTLISDAISGRAIINEDVETQPEKVPACIIDENVCWKSCQNYFTYDAWACVEQLIECIEKHPVYYYCGRCTNQIDDTTENSVQCGSCLIWCHFKCVKKSL